MIAQPPTGTERARQQQAYSAAARGLRRLDGRSATAGITAVVVRVGVVVTQTEEPDEPEHEQANVEDPESDHEDPTLRAHTPIVPRSRRRRPTSCYL